MSSRKCIMGCQKEIGQKLHNFPASGKRRAEWCRILGIYPRSRTVKICSAHFSNLELAGNRINKFTLPNPPVCNTTQTQSLFQIPNYQKKQSADAADNIITIFPNELNFQTAEDFNEIIETDTTGKQLIEETSLENNNYSENNVKDFEIRKGNTNDMIIKGRYVQTKDYLVVTYTPPRKWTLQEQVDLLDKQCEQQLRQIRHLNKQNYRLHIELKKYEKLLPKLRYLQAKASYFCSQLKKCKQERNLLRKRNNTLKNE
ncbi:hypothetical protein FF38_14102 [Lucilia cuprina]|uniref:THAP-type domain-containing protein n=1 Tax=Lucilia cuprina TaxID=7375 RepID=A0A0L0C7K6_LUCCU|nr:hypothetical protein CVS40_8955 [Lucilia cuprina]KNC28236.1 hypothetical protein FF38_14102 [Lucilia cuprina]